MEPISDGKNILWLIVGVLLWILAIAINFADRAV